MFFYEKTTLLSTIFAWFTDTEVILTDCRVLISARFDSHNSVLYLRGQVKSFRLFEKTKADMDIIPYRLFLSFVGANPLGLSAFQPTQKLEPIYKKSCPL